MAARRFVVVAGGASLLGALVEGLLERHWPGLVTENRQESAGMGAVRVEDGVSGRRLFVFIGPPTREGLTEAKWDPGASAITITASPSEVEAALRSLDGGPSYVSADVLRAFAKDPSVAPRLTAREAEVAGLLAKGLSNREIAERLVISPHTVRSHLQAMSARLGVSSRGRLAAKVREMGLL